MYNTPYSNQVDRITVKYRFFLPANTKKESHARGERAKMLFRAKCGDIFLGYVGYFRTTLICHANQKAVEMFYTAEINMDEEYLGKFLEHVKIAGQVLCRMFGVGTVFYETKNHMTAYHNQLGTIQRDDYIAGDGELLRNVI